jgi:hypothetical protein
MASYTLRTFIDLVNAVREELKIQSSDTTSISRIKRDLNIVYKEVVRSTNGGGSTARLTSQHEPLLAAGTISVTQNSNTAVLSQAPTTSRRGYKISVDGFTEIYTIQSHTAGSTTIKLDGLYNGTTNSEATYRIWTDRIALPLDCKETTTVYQDYNNQPLEGMGLQEYRRVVSAQPKAEGNPRYYTTIDYLDPTDASSTSIPSVSTRASSGITKTLIFSGSLPDTIEVGTKLRIRGTTSPSYSGEVFVGSVSTTSAVNDTITYTGRSP